MSDLYRTVAYPAEAVFTEKRSKFLAFVYPIKSVDEAKEHVAALSKRYFESRHVCRA
jgi:putative IMPACT (imprinted ancient) family translation regulator